MYDKILLNAKLSFLRKVYIYMWLGKNLGKCKKIFFYLTCPKVGNFTWFLQYFPKNRAILVQKLWGEKKVAEIRFSLF